MKEFMEVWRSGEALEGPEIIALVRRFTLGCVEVLLRARGGDEQEVASLRRRAYERYLVSPGRMRYYSATPEPRVAGIRLQIKAFTERFQPFERIMIWPTEGSLGVSVRINLVPVGERTYQVGSIFAGLLWWNTSAPSADELKTAEEALTRAWGAFEQIPAPLPQQEAGERHFLGGEFRASDWSGSEEALTSYLGNLLNQAVTVVQGTATIHERLRRRGYRFSHEQIATFYAALKAKGFVILSGLSGTGKTKLAQEFAASLGVDEHHFLLEPVKPDWRDNTGLLGYWNPVTGQYETTRFLRLLLLAAEEYRTGEPPIAGDSLESYIRRRLGEAGVRGRLLRHRDTLHQVSQWRGTEEQLRLLWLHWDNGVGLMRPHGELPPDYQVLREATDRLLDRTLSVADRATAAAAVFRRAGITTPPWTRIIRALAALEPALVPATGSRKYLRAAGRALGRRIRLRREPESVRWADMASGWEALVPACHPLMERLGLEPTDGAALSLVIDLACRFDLNRKGAEPEPEDEGEEEAEAIRPYFVVLDEMNLARVEYYLADILSVLESGRRPDGFSHGAIALHGQATDIAADDGLRVPPTLRLPPNLYFIGTINTDETTFAFSPKVLDRAFTMEVRAVDLTNYPPEVEPTPPDEEPVDESLLADFTRQGRFAQLTKADVVDWGRGRREYVALLDQLNQALLPYDLGFGYRVVDEVLAFVGALAESPLGSTLSEDEAFDAAVMMKVLPKFHGPRNRVERPLQAVVDWAGESFGRTAQKAGQMLERARLVGHTRFS